MDITREIKVDWQGSNWMGTPDFSQAIDDLTPYVKSVSFNRGKDKELGNFPAATAELLLKNSDGRFSPPNVSSPLYGYLIPWKIIRIRAQHNAIWYNLFFGFINRYSIRPHKGIQEAYVYCTDGLDVLARQIITQDNDNTSTLSDAEALDKILDAAGWGATMRSFDTDGGQITEYPECYVF